MYLRKYWDRTPDAVYTQVKIEDGLAVEAYVGQIGGNARGNASNYVGLTEDELREQGFEDHEASNGRVDK